MTPAQAPGWYGKLSCLGDFAQRRLPPGCVRACDEWLSRGMAQAQSQLGTPWLRTYLAAPVWRFVWGPGVVGASEWWFGLMMPSCDSVGRYFPLVVAQARPEAPDDRFGWAHLDLWWQQLSQAALATLSDGASVDRFEAELAAAPPWPVVSPPLVQRVPGSERWRLAAGAGAGELAQALAAEGLRERLQGRSLWWATRPGAPQGSCVLAAGLPTPAQFVALLQAA